MSNDINFSELWSAQSASAPDIHELINKAQKLKSKTRIKLIGAGFLLLATAAFIIWIGINLESKQITTIAGIVLTILAIALNLFYFTGMIKDLSSKENNASGKDYLNQLIRLKQKQGFMHRTVMSIYFVMLSTGIFLYMIEFIMQMELVRAIVAYALTAAWFAFNWFYLRPRTIKKQQTEVNKLIAEFERVNSQFIEE